jgi:hypothetical protein
VGDAEGGASTGSASAGDDAAGVTVGGANVGDVDRRPCMLKAPSEPTHPLSYARTRVMQAGGSSVLIAYMLCYY